MKFPVVIIMLAWIFTWNALAIEKLSGDNKIVLPRLATLELPISQASPSNQVIQCKFESTRNPASLNSSEWNVIANGATFEKRMITLFNSALNEVMTMNCYKFSAESPLKTSPISDSQLIQVLKASQVQIM